MPLCPCLNRRTDNTILNMNAVKINRLLSQAALTFISVAILFIFSHAGKNKEWFQKITSYWEDYKEQRASTASTEEIREERWGLTYQICKSIRKNIADRHIKNPLILLEPNSYVEKTIGIKMPEPVVFYYFTGLRAVWTNASNVKEATHILRFQKGGTMRIDSIASPEQLQQFLNFYKPYPQAL